MRWPFGPPHLTLKPSNKKHQKKKKQKNNQTKKQKKEKKKPPTKKTAKTPKNSFSVISQFFPFFWVAFQNFPFLTPWPRKRAPKKHYKNRGFRAFFFGKQLCVTKRPFWDQKTQKFINFSYHFFLPIFFSFKNKKHQNMLKPLFL